MESAKNSSGVVVQGRLLTLREVQTREWTCATCPVDIPVYPSKWPCVLCTIDTRAKNCEHPHFYWKARKERPHRSPCPHWQDAVIVAVDNRVVRSRRGVPGVGPRVIRFDSSARIEAAAGGALGQGGGTRVRRVNGETCRPMRADSRTTTSEIARACQFFIEYPDDRDRALVVPGVPSWAKQYRTVFKNLIRADGLAGRTHIWWARILRLSMPTGSGAVLSVPMDGGRRIVIDRGDWGIARAAFDRTLSGVFESARDTVRDKQPGEWVNVLAFGFGRLDANGVVLVDDPRKFHALIEVSARATS